MSLIEKTLLVFICTSSIALGGCRSRSQSTNSQSSGHANASELELISASYEGNVKRMEAALKLGADVNAFDDKFGTPLAGASYSGNVEAVRLLIDKGAVVNKKDHEGITPLMNAVLNGSADVVRLLLSKGADVNVVSTRKLDGREAKTTALMLARGARRPELVTLLVQAGAKE